MAFGHYLDVFPIYVKRIHGKEIEFEIKKVNGGIKLKAQSTNNVSLREIDGYLDDYIGIFLDQKYETFNESQMNMDNKIELFKLQQFIRDLKMDNRTLTDKVRSYYDQTELLKSVLNDKNQQIDDYRFLFRSFQSGQNKVLELASSNFDPMKVQLDVHVHQTQNTNFEIKQTSSPLLSNSSEFDPHELLKDLTDKAIRIAEKKKEQIEDLHNNDFAHFLRDKLYYVTDQTQSGISSKNYGELDIMIRSQNGTLVSIIEAFRLSSCGKKGTVVSSHIDKLLHDYDTVGHKTNFVIVYAEAVSFSNLWGNYIDYMQDLNSKNNFRAEYPLISFIDTAKSNVTDIKIGLAIHKRENTNIEVYHIFINMK